GERRANHHRQVGAHRTETVLTDYLLARAIGPQKPRCRVATGCTTPTREGQLWIDGAFVQEVVYFLRHHVRMDAVRALAVLESRLVIVHRRIPVLLFRGCELGNPGVTLLGRQAVGQLVDEGFLITDDTERERPVAAQFFRYRVYPNGLGIRVETVFAEFGHAVLPDEDHEVGAEHGVVRHARIQTVIVGHVAPCGARTDDGNFMALSGCQQRLPGLALEHPLACDEDGALGLDDHVDS